MTGEWPEKQIDHIDGNPLNNKWDNLRDVTSQENGRNKRILKNNTSGFTGVCWDDVNKKWRAFIRVDRKTIHIGRFTNIQQAIDARKDANIKYGFHENHGKR